ncbi:hypothetical protein E2C01_004378 [Portunus trituberculatus]|uniref:Uncharacterized protein n=1 Tax=Portunus trituberculatus TaxID=210409 RepID=A0A5B7CPQ4_PORTR|nr:hypothetical protein [Portunus trituberculatus]
MHSLSRTEGVQHGPRRWRPRVFSGGRGRLPRPKDRPPPVLGDMWLASLRHKSSSTSSPAFDT